MRAMAMSTKLLLLSICLVACDPAEPVSPDAVPAVPTAQAPWPFALPPGFPTPRLPATARLTPELAELGRHLFFDRRLSANGTMACGTCHRQDLAFTDGKPRAIGSTGQVLARNAMSLTNVAYNPTQTWANPVLTSLELQAAIPMFAEHPIELGIVGHETEIMGRFEHDAAYQTRFAAAFPDDAAPFTFLNIQRAIAAFERRLISGNSRVDRYTRGDAQALTAAELRGMNAFFSETFECHHCHGSFNFTVAIDHAGLAERTPMFFNTGLYNTGPEGQYGNNDHGLFDLTSAAADYGRFRPPTLRNIAVTGPYMHDGSIATLEEVIDAYAAGGRVIAEGPNAGDGRKNPNKHSFVSGFVMTAEERADMLAFLRALTDEQFLTDPSISDPFKVAPE